MKSYVKEFKYHGTARKLFVMRENEVAVDGLELTYMSEEDAAACQEALKDHDIKCDFSKGEPIDGYKPEWGKAWRRYNKSAFEVDEDEQAN